MTPSKSELHEGAKRIAYLPSLGVEGQQLERAIIALAESHAAAETAQMRELLERIRDDVYLRNGCAWCCVDKLQTGGKHTDTCFAPAIDRALAPGAGARYAERVAKLEKVAVAAGKWNAPDLRCYHGRDEPEHVTPCNYCELVDALAALDAGEKENRR